MPTPYSCPELLRMPGNQKGQPPIPDLFFRFRQDVYKNEDHSKKKFGLLVINRQP
jgi:hypothetical protein